MTIFTDILFWVMVCVCLGGVSVPLTLGVLSYLLNTWFRQDYRTWGNDFVKFVFKQSDQDANWCFCVVTSIIAGLLAFLLGITEHGRGSEIYNHPVTGIISLLILLTPAIIFVPRYVIDIFKGLQLNRKTGDLERLNQLEKEMMKLREKVNKNS